VEVVFVVMEAEALAYFVLGKALEEVDVL